MRSKSARAEILSEQKGPGTKPVKESVGAAGMARAYAQKAKAYYIRYGAKKTFYKGLQYLQNKREHQQYQMQFQDEAVSNQHWNIFCRWLEDTPHEFIDILPMPVGWNAPLFQRYQHLSLQVGKIGGIALYGTRPSIDRDVVLYKFINSKLCIVNLENPQVYQKLFDILDTRKELKYVRIQSTDWFTTVSQIKSFIEHGYHIVYEYLDEISPQIMGEIPQEIYKRHEFVLQNKHITVIATSDKLYNQAKQVRDSNIAMLNNGVDYDFWHIRREDITPPEDLQPALKKTVVGYHGSLASWLDYKLLCRIAEDGRYSLVLIGHEYDQCFRKSGLLKCKNVFYLGEKKYQELNQYAAFYDIAILPFIVNDMTRSVSPVKIFEYMAAGKPIVSSALPECQKYKSCLCAESHNEFVKKLEYAASIRNDAVYLQKLEKDARENTWEVVTGKMVRMIKANSKTEQNREQ